MGITNQEISLQEANEVLFDGEKGFEDNQEKPDLKKSDERLLQQKIVEEFTLSSVPYYKKPSVKIASIILLGCPLIWLVWSAFGSSPIAAEKKEENPYAQENEQLKVSLDEARQQLEEMNLQASIANQQKDIQLIEPVESTPAKKETEPQPKPQPAPVKVARTTQPDRPVARIQPVYKPPVVEEIDPMEQWLAQADRGYSRSSFNKPYLDEAIASVIPVPPPTPDYKSERHLPLPETVVYSTAETTIVTKTKEIKPIPQTPLLDESRLTSIRKQPTLFDDDQLRARLNRGGEILASRNNPTRSEELEFQEQVEDSASSTENPEVVASSSTPIKTNKDFNNVAATQSSDSQSNSVEILDIGSKAKATLVEGIAWTQESFNQDRKYILYLEEGFENSRGQEVLQSGTRLIAQIERVSSSGLFTMKVTHIVKSFNEPKIPVPPGTLEILAKDGSPLQAKLKRKGNSDFLSDLGSVVAPGVERALDSSTNVLVNDNFSFTTSNSDPLTSGLSGAARGASNLVRQRTRGSSNRSSTLSYF